MSNNSDDNIVNRQVFILLSENETYCSILLCQILFLLGTALQLVEGQPKFSRHLATSLDKLQLAFMSPRVILTSLNFLFFNEQDWLQVFGNFYSRKQNFTGTEFTSQIPNSTRPGLSNTTFFAHCLSDTA